MPTTTCELGARVGFAGPYAHVRHPQYDDFVLIIFGFLLQWPRLVTLISFPLLVRVYVRLAYKEEREVHGEFGSAWDEYSARTPGFIPRLPHRRARGEDRNAHA
jgi:Cu+-exporting ATPase